MKESLKSIHSRLQSELGSNFASYITIKRMSAKSAFQGMDTHQIESALRGRYAKQPKIGLEQATAVVPTPDNTELLETIGALGQSIKKIQLALQTGPKDNQAQSIVQAAQQIDAVRNTLMAKYDAVCSQQAQTIETQRQLIKDLQSSSVLSMEIGRLRGQMQFVLDKLNL